MRRCCVVCCVVVLAPADRDRISGVRRGRLKGRRTAGRPGCDNGGADNEENNVEDGGDSGEEDSEEEEESEGRMKRKGR